MTSLISQSDLNVTYLHFSASCFDKNEVEEGKVIFALVCREPRTEENGVYSMMARKKGGTPTSYHYGKLFFWDIGGISTPSSHKAAAIYSYLNHVGFQKNHIPQSIANHLTNQIIVFETIREKYRCFEAVKKILAIGSEIFLYALKTIGIVQEGKPLLTSSSQPPTAEENLPYDTPVELMPSPSPLSHLFPQLFDYMPKSTEEEIDFPSFTEADYAALSSDLADSLHATSGWVYNGATHRNGFILTYQKLQKKLEELHRQLDKFKQHVIELGLDSVRTKIEEIQSSRDLLDPKNWSVLGEAIRKSIASTNSPEVSPLVICAAWQVMEKFKEFGDKGHEATQVGQYIEHLMELERGLERAKNGTKPTEIKG